MKISAQLSFNKIRHDQDTDAHLVLSLTAPVKGGETARPPICIVPVIDVSGSMVGPKLDYAKRSAIKLIEHLKPGDYCGLVVFDSTVRVIVPPQKLTADGKDRIKAEIGKLQTGGSTNFSGGLLAALEAVDRLDLADSVLQRVVMFTDGQANAGVATKPAEILRLLVNAGRTTVSAFGYGSDADQQFLLDFSKEGKGNYAFIQDPDGALSAFGKELGGLLSTYATNLTLRLDPLADHEVTQVVSDVEAEQEAIGGNVTIKIPDILGEETRHLVLAVKLKEQKQAFPRAVNIFDVRVEYDIIDAAGKKTREAIEVKAKAQFVKAGEEDKDPTPELDEIIALAEVIRAQIEAEEAAKANNFDLARQVMQKTSANIRRRGRAKVAEAADAIALRLADAEVYTSNQGYLRSFQVGGTRGMGAASYDSSAADALDGLGVVLSNSVQANTSTSFAGPSAPASPPSVAQAVPVSLDQLWAGTPDLSPAGLILAPTPAPEPTPAPRRIRQAKSSRW